MSEEEEKRQNVNNVCCSDLDGKSVASLDDKVRSLRHHGNELNQLHQSQVGLPPDWDRLSGFGDLGVHADEVVCVHDSVDESVEDNGQVNISIIKDVRVEPVEQKDGRVVVDMEEGKLSPLLSQNNEDGVPEIPNLRNVKQPQEVGKRRIILAVSNTWCERVSAAVS